MRFVPYTEVSSVPNVIVDGKGTGNTVLTLSHWPKSGTPAGLKADTSAAIVFNYLDRPEFHVAVNAVSNNHFDEDGLVGIFALLSPSAAQRHRDILLDAASAGDFGVYRQPDAARIALALQAYADRDRSPLPAHIFTLPYPEQVATLYMRLLDVLTSLLAGVATFRNVWGDEDAELTASEAAIRSGAVTIEEQPSLDFAIVRVSESTPFPHPFALHTRTPCTRLLVVHGRRVELHFRYEGWVQLASRRPALRVDLRPLAEELNQVEKSGGLWTFDGVDEITPKLHLENSPVTSISPDEIRQRAEHHLRNDQPAWNPYD